MSSVDIFWIVNLSLIIFVVAILAAIEEDKNV